MARQLTLDEYNALKVARLAYDRKSELLPSVGFEAGFKAGLEYQQAKLDKLTAMLAAAGVNKNIIEGVLSEELIND